MATRGLRRSDATEPVRVIVCACGWSGVYRTLILANEAHADHTACAPAGDHRYAIGNLPRAA